MAISLPCWTMGRAARRCLLGLALGAATATLSGCTLLDVSSLTGESRPGAPAGQAREAFSYWDKNITLAPDPEHNLQLTPCLVGRLTLLGPQDKPVSCAGAVTVTLYDERPPQGGAPVKLEEWKIDKDNLKKMMFRDDLGMWGYTLALPTQTCVNLQHGRIEVSFKPDDGPALYAGSNVIKPSFAEISRRNGGTLPANCWPVQKGVAAQQRPGTMTAGYGPQYPQQMAPQYQQQALAPQYQQPAIAQAQYFQPVVPAAFPQQVMMQPAPQQAMMPAQFAPPMAVQLPHPQQGYPQNMAMPVSYTQQPTAGQFPQQPVQALQFPGAPLPQQGAQNGSAALAAPPATLPRQVTEAAAPQPVAQLKFQPNGNQ